MNVFNNCQKTIVTTEMALLANAVMLNQLEHQKKES